MNQGKIWLVVKPTVGLPAFLGGVAVIALCVHAAVLSNAGWYKQYFNGKAAPKTAAVTQPAEPQLVIATDISKPPGVTMCRNGACSVISSMAASSAESRFRANPRNTVAPGASASFPPSASNRLCCIAPI